MVEKIAGVDVFAANRDEDFEVLVEQETWDADAGEFVTTPWDLSSESLSVALRAWRRGSTDPIATWPLAKVSGGAGGRARGFVRFSEKVPECDTEVVVIDASNNNAETPSGKRETRVRWRTARVESAPGPAAP